jgi:predicted kinase
VKRAETKTLICCVGLPRSGKSTWARAQGYPMVNPDAVRLAIHGHAFIANAEPFVWATSHAMVRALFLAGHDIVILDATNTTRKRRDEWRSEEWDTRFKLFDEAAEVCTVRAERGGRPDLVPVIARMAAQFEPPQDDEERWP